MAFWQKKSLAHYVKKYLESKKITYKDENGKISFELDLSSNNLHLFPYVSLDEEISCVSVLINIRKKKETEEVATKLNDFNVISKYFTAKMNAEGIIYLEYNTTASTDMVGEILNEALMTLNTLSAQIDNL